MGMFQLFAYPKKCLLFASSRCDKLSRVDDIRSEIVFYYCIYTQVEFCYNFTHVSYIKIPIE